MTWKVTRKVLYRKCNEKKCFVIDATLPSDNPLHFWKNLLKEVKRIVTTTDDKTRDEKLQYEISRSAAKITLFSSGNIDKYKYLAGEEKLLSQQYESVKDSDCYFSEEKTWSLKLSEK